MSLFSQEFRRMDNKNDYDEEDVNDKPRCPECRVITQPVNPTFAGVMKSMGVKMERIHGEICPQCALIYEIDDILNGGE